MRGSIFHRHYGYRPGAQRGASVPTTFTMVATTTEDAQTVTINRLQAANAYEIDWGDGSAPQEVAAGYSGTLTHQYASAGAVVVTVKDGAASAPPCAPGTPNSANRIIPRMSTPRNRL